MLIVKQKLFKYKLNKCTWFQNNDWPQKTAIKGNSADNKGNRNKELFLEKKKQTNIAHEIHSFFRLGLSFSFFKQYIYTHKPSALKPETNKTKWNELRKKQTECKYLFGFTYYKL